MNVPVEWCFAVQNMHKIEKSPAQFLHNQKYAIYLQQNQVYIKIHSPAQDDNSSCFECKSLARDDNFFGSQSVGDSPHVAMTSCDGEPPAYTLRCMRQLAFPTSSLSPCHCASGYAMRPCPGKRSGHAGWCEENHRGRSLRI